MQRKILYILSVHQYTSVCDIVKTRYKRNQSTFTAAGGADDGQSLTRSHGETYVF